MALGQGRARPQPAVERRALRIATTLSTLVILGTVAFLRPWYWDLVIAVVVVAAWRCFLVLVGALERRSAPARWGAITVALVSVVLGSALVMLGATAAVIDGAALAGGTPVPVAHDRQVLAHPVLYRCSGGRRGTGTAPRRHWRRPRVPGRRLPTSQWAAAVVGSGFGVGSLSSGGCWIDPVAPTSSDPASSTSSGPFPADCTGS